MDCGFWRPTRTDRRLIMSKHGPIADPNLRPMIHHGFETLLETTFDSRII